MSRELDVLIERLIRKSFFVGMTRIEELQGALKELINLLFAHFVGSQERWKVEVGKSAIGHAAREKLAQAARINGAELANFFEDHPAQRILKHLGREQFADFRAGAALNQDGTQKPQGVFLEQRLVVRL